MKDKPQQQKAKSIGSRPKLTNVHFKIFISDEEVDNVKNGNIVGVAEEFNLNYTELIK